MTHPLTPIAVDWETPPIPPDDLIFDDGEPLETHRHRKAMNILIDSLNEAYGEREDYFTGGNMFIYFSSERVFNPDFRGPDFFAVLDIDGSYPRQGWVVWNEKGRYPDVIVELMSDSTAKIDITTKKDLYEKTFRCSHYFVYDPFDSSSLKGRKLNGVQKYQEILPDSRGWLWCERLGLWLGVWSGTLKREEAPWLRFYDREGQLILLPEELAEIERQQAAIERQQAAIERQQAAIERQRAETERQRAERLATRLRELGEDPEFL